MRIKKIIKNHDIRTNSKEIKKGDIFFCTLGLIDKNKYITEAIEKGCSLVVTNKYYHKRKCVYKKDINVYLRKLLDLKYHYPLHDKTLIGVTGTDGKTTTVSILRNMLNGASIGTNGLEFKGYQKDIHNTTPSLDYLFEYFNIINENNIENIIMEVSSESYLTKRIPTLEFDIGLFLNISIEHLDKHKDFNDYLRCKKELLLHSKKKIINMDIPSFSEIIKDLDNYFTFGYQKGDLQIIKYYLYYDKTVIKYKYQNKKYKVISPLLGKYNVYNLTASIACMINLNYPMEEIIKRVSLIESIKGRMEKINIYNKHLLIDYAHTLNGTYEVIKFLHKYSHKHLIVVIGCAGGRYKEKRPLIGKIVLKYAKLVIFTTDDPRWENPKIIIEEMISKTKKKNYYVILSRSDAINTALDMANGNDLVVILGKGRDKYMAIENELIPYSDMEVIKKYFKNMLSKDIDF